MNTVKVCNDFGHRSLYMQLYDACVSPTLNYAAGFWGLKVSTAINTFHNKNIQCLVEVHRFGLIPGILGDMGRMVCTMKMGNDPTMKPSNQNDRGPKK